MNAVQEQTSRVSVNTPRVWIRPCFTGWLTSAVAAAFGALPSPASLLNIPRLKPHQRGHWRIDAVQKVSDSFLHTIYFTFCPIKRTVLLLFS